MILPVYKDISLTLAYIGITMSLSRSGIGKSSHLICGVAMCLL